jgi:hypothetical protein
MASTQTVDINARNVYNIRSQIAMKKQSCPYMATIDYSHATLTDQDTFPYPRWFRGDYMSSDPIVAEREAGWRQRVDSCYRVNAPPEKQTAYPSHCFESACSTVYPCYPKYMSKWTDRDALNVVLNKGCVIQYR